MTLLSASSRTTRAKCLDLSSFMHDLSFKVRAKIISRDKILSATDFPHGDDKATGRSESRRPLTEGES
jgi:hypothetical protein